MQADILHIQHDYDIVVLYKRKHKNGMSIFKYGTPGLAEDFVRGDSQMGKTVIKMFQAFAQERGSNNQ